MILTLEKILQSQGFGSRKECRLLIKNSNFSINGEILTDPQQKIEAEGCKFSLCDEEFLYRQKVYIALHKPSNFECSVKPTFHPSVFELLPDEFLLRNVQCVGRLDQDSTGLLLLSDDGQFIHQIISPKKHVEKVYQATLARPIEAGFTEKLLAGVKLNDEDEIVKALSCQKLSEKSLELIVDQGKYHQVKRMIAAAGNHCEQLHRLKIGQWNLADLDLEEGEWRYLQL